MVAITFQPEKALKKAEELLTVNQTSDAFLLLHSVATNKRNKTWLPGYDLLMIKLVELAVELKKGRLAKEALHQFKNLCQNSSTLDALEKVMARFLELSLAKVEGAKEKSVQIAIDIEDLEASETPESIMLSTVTDEDTKDRTDREYLTPWLKFLWETYRTILDVLRNNQKVEGFYHNTAQSAFNFCLKYNRKTEFRRLCEILRNHLETMDRYGHLPNAVTLANPDSLQLHLDTRFVQLKIACELELWQEAFKSIEDIHKLMQKSKKAPKLASQAEYYAKLAQVFFVAENRLMHAAALKKHLTLVKHISKNMSNDDKRKLSSLVMLAALSIPVASSVRGQYGFLDSNEQQNRNLKLAALLDMTAAPTREQLLRELISKDLSEHVLPQVSELYNILETEFIPLSLSKRLMPILEFLRADEKLSVYVKPIEEVALTRILLQLGEVYKTIKTQKLFDLAPFADPIDIEKFIMEGCKRGDFQIRMNHVEGTITFTVSSLSSPAEDNLGGARLQTVDIRSQVARLSKKLSEAVNVIDPSIKAQRVEAKTKYISQLSAQLEKEHLQALERLKTIEHRKVEREKSLEEKERKEAQLKAQKERAEAEAEKNRLIEEAKKRDLERLAQQKAEIEQARKRKVAEELKKKSEVIGIKIDVSELENLPPEELVARQVQHIESEKREMKQRLVTLYRKIDHLERAVREEEIPYLNKFLEEHMKAIREGQERTYLDQIEKTKEKHQKDLELKAMLGDIKADADAFKESILGDRRKEHKKAVEAARQEMMAEKEIRRQKYIEEWERKEEERLEKEREEESARRQREREKERDAEERRLAEERRSAAPPPSSAPPASDGPKKYVPPTKREAPAAAPNRFEALQGDEEEAAPEPSRDRFEALRGDRERDRERESFGERERERDRDRSFRSEPSRSEGDRWGGAPRRQEPEGDRWGGAPRRQEPEAAPLPSRPGSYVPPSLRNKQQEGSDGWTQVKKK